MPRISPEAPPNPRIPHVLVLATAATTQSGAYTRALNALGLRATEKACPLLVPLVEEGWLNDPRRPPSPSKSCTSICSKPSPRLPMPPPCCSVAPTTLFSRPSSRPRFATCVTPCASSTPPTPPPAQSPSLLRVETPHSPTNPDCAFYATDSIEKFQRLGSAFLGRPLPAVSLIDLGG